MFCTNNTLCSRSSETVVLLVKSIHFFFFQYFIQEWNLDFDPLHNLTYAEHYLYLYSVHVHSNIYQYMFTILYQYRIFRQTYQAKCRHLLFYIIYSEVTVFGRILKIIFCHLKNLYDEGGGPCGHEPSNILFELIIGLK